MIYIYNIAWYLVITLCRLAADHDINNTPTEQQIEIVRATNSQMSHKINYRNLRTAVSDFIVLPTAMLSPQQFPAKISSSRAKLRRNEASFCTVAHDYRKFEVAIDLCSELRCHVGER